MACRQLKKTDNATAYTNRGSTRYEAADYRGAAEDFSKAISLQADYTFAWNNRAAAYLKLEDYKKAAADAGKAISLNPQYAEAYLNRGHAREMLREADGACH